MPGIGKTGIGDWKWAIGNWAFHCMTATKLAWAQGDLIMNMSLALDTEFRHLIFSTICLIWVGVYSTHCNQDGQIQNLCLPRSRQTRIVEISLRKRRPWCSDTLSSIEQRIHRLLIYSRIALNILLLPREREGARQSMLLPSTTDVNVSHVSSAC